MKCLSVCPPWAPLLVLGLKPVENRSQPTKYRGPVLIHASRRYDLDGRMRLLCHGTPLSPYDRRRVFFSADNFHDTAGAIIGQVELYDCVRGYDSPWAEPGMWHWLVRDAKRFDTTVPYPGRLGLFEAPDPDAGHLFRPHDGQTRRVCLRQEPCDVVITRPGFWGNPYKVEEGRGTYRGRWFVRDWEDSPVEDKPTKEAALVNCLARYQGYIKHQPGFRARLFALRGKRLGCFCAPDQPCHGDVLVDLVREVCGQ